MKKISKKFMESSILNPVLPFKWLPYKQFLPNREVDTDLDGNLSDVELRAFFEKNCKAQLASLDIFDANNDNVISAEEFVTGIKSMESMSNEAARHNWEEFSGTVDVTGDGMVSFEEVWIDGKKRGRRC